jgi:hypothetical protein
LGSDSFKADLVKDHALIATSRAWEAVGAKEVRQLQWSAALVKALTLLGKDARDCLGDSKSAPWKIATAAFLKSHTLASNRWLAEHLCMGSPIALSHYVGHLRRHGGEATPLLSRLSKLAI